MSTTIRPGGPLPVRTCGIGPSRFALPARQLGSVATRYRLAYPGATPSPAVRLPCATSDRSDRTSEGTPEEQGEKKARLLAVLFLAKEPLSSRKLSQYANLADGTEARTLVRQLRRELVESGRALRIREVAGGFQLVTDARYARWIRRLEHIDPPARLSTPALETLSVVAYRQPVTRAVVEAVRGVACGEILNQLMSRDLIRVSGRSDELGRPYLYSTTRRFLETFGLRSLDELPEASPPPTLSSNPKAATD